MFYAHWKASGLIYTMGNIIAQRASAEQLNPNPDDPNPQAAWWCKLLARVVAVFCGGCEYLIYLFFDISIIY